jgi:tetratricopeptide (TPR) repeat protein
MPETTVSIETALKSASELLVCDPIGALDQLNNLVAQNPDSRAFRLAAAALRALDRHEEAEQAELQGIRFGFAGPLRSARSAQQSGRSDEAKALAGEYLQSHPDDLLAMTIAAEAELGLGRGDDAEALLRRVVARAPSFAPASMLLANGLSSQLRLREAANVLQALIERVPQEISAKRFLADIRAQVNDPSAAASLYEEIVTSKTVTAADHYKLAQNLRAAGRRGESITALRRSIEAAPLGGHAWWALAFYFPQEVTEEDEQLIRAAAAAPGFRTDDLRLLYGAVSILDHRRGDYDGAFQAILSSKALPSRTPGYDPDLLSRHVDELIAGYTPKVFERLHANASMSDEPIFIVGLPRSGSTLIERILGQHSIVEAMGEIPVMPRLVGAEQPDNAARYRSLLPDSLTDEKLNEMADWYLDRSHEYRRTGKCRFSDKYNGNWIRAGLIRLMFPKAKILDVRRDPLDCCWSVFKTMLVDDYARDQRHLARYYVDYIRYMDAMAMAAPGGILTVRYEELVADLEGQTRRILDFLGLEFERACVDFHLSTAPVTTPSSEQVRRSINSEGIGSAEPYRPWLQTLIDELEFAQSPTGVVRRSSGRGMA